MTKKVDLIIHHASQICRMPTHAQGPQRGHDLGDLGLVLDGAIAIRDGVIVEVGSDVLHRYEADEMLDAGGRFISPGLVDPHTHTVWAGHRANEFERRIAGASYQELMAEGGGINASMKATRYADLDTLIAESSPRLRRMMQHGSTTVEVKTGYGLSTESEIKMLDAILALSHALPLDLVPTFLGAHAVPPEFAQNPDTYVDVVVHEMIPEVARWKAAHWDGALFCDVFCETGAFSVAQSRRILEAAKAAGLGLKIHSDEFDPLGGTAMAVELGATSADHLVATSPAEIALLGKSATVAVSMPPTPFGLGHQHYTPAKAMLEAGAALAIATDCNPGTAWNESMQFVMALATRYLKLTPAQALACATVNAAFAIGKGGQVGTLDAGAQADIVIWEADDYRHLGYRFGSNLVHQVIKRGKIVHTQD